MKDELQVTIHGGAGSVTGANFLWEYDNKRFLFDVGMTQEGHDPSGNIQPFPYSPESINDVFISHAHIDHIGRLPRLVRQGFTGAIYSTPATRELALPMLMDAAKVFRLHKKEFHIEEDIFDEIDIMKTINLWKTIDYHKPFNYTKDITITPYHACHILGACMYRVKIKNTVIGYTGDMGTSPHALLQSLEAIPGLEYVFMECVYGGRHHPHIKNRREALESCIEKVTKEGGTLLVPVFSLERTQEVLFELNELYRNKQVSPLPVYLDTPLGTKITDIYQKFKHDLNIEAQEILKVDPDIFSFKELTILHGKTDVIQKKIESQSKIVLAGSGMSEGGKILSYYKHYIEDPHSMVAFVGYQSAGTLGRRILEGQKEIKISKDELHPKCAIENISGFSGHRDTEGLLEFIEIHSKTLKYVFCVLGEPKSTMTMAQKISDNYGIATNAPDGKSPILIPIS